MLSVVCFVFHDFKIADINASKFKDVNVSDDYREMTKSKTIC